MSKNIEINLFDTKSIKNAIEEVQRYRNEILAKTNEFTRRLAEEGVIVAKMQIMSFPAVDTGELLQSISMRPGEIISNGNTFYVYTDCPYAGFVEFGTGIVGESNPHPMPQAVVGENGVTYSSYDQNGHGDEGWFYYGRDGQWHHTKGMPSRPFMYNTARDLYFKVGKIAMEVFGREVVS